MSRNSKSVSQGRLRDMYDRHSRFVTRTLWNGGVHRSELDDEVQRTFIAVANRLNDVRDGSERSFLFKVARHTASHARRSFARRREFPTDRMPDRIEARGTPEDAFARKQVRNLLGDLLGAIEEPLRTVFVLAELEGVDTKEIAKRLSIPRGTVASRLRRARAQLRRQVAAVELAWDLGVEGADPIEEPKILRNESTSGLEHALLAAGLRSPASATTLAATLASLALR